MDEPIRYQVLVSYDRKDHKVTVHVDGDTIASFDLQNVPRGDWSAEVIWRGKGPEIGLWPHLPKQKLVPKDRLDALAKDFDERADGKRWDIAGLWTHAADLVRYERDKQ